MTESPFSFMLSVLSDVVHLPFAGACKAWQTEIWVWTQESGHRLHICMEEEAHMAMDMLSCKPIYEQIYDRIKLLILSDAIAADEQIPSVRSMAIELSVNPNTVQKAYTMLEEDGLVYVVKGCGNFASGGEKITQLKRTFIRDRVKLLYEEARQYGIGQEELLEMLREMKDEKDKGGI